jgi:hypothetical protein
VADRDPAAIKETTMTENSIRNGKPQAKANKRRAAAAANPSPKIVGSSEPRTPTSWKEIEAGALVIAHESSEDGWWEAIVTEINADIVTLRWRDYPRQPAVNRTRSQIAFLAGNK